MFGPPITSRGAERSAAGCAALDADPDVVDEGLPGPAAAHTHGSPPSLKWLMSCRATDLGWTSVAESVRPWSYTKQVAGWRR